MTYTQAKACINELDREGLEKLLKDYGEEVIKTAFGCGISPRELQAVCSWNYKSKENKTEKEGIAK